MHNDNNIDFDLQIRSMLQNAEEDNIPSLVWESLSSELDRRDRKKVVALRWRRALVSVAAAAAVVAGAFVVINRGGESEISPVQPLVADGGPQTVQVQEEASIEDQIAASSTIKLADVPTPTAKPKSNAVPTEITSSEYLDTVQPEAEEPVIDETPAQQTVETANAKPEIKPETQKEEKADKAEWSDPFARMEYEDRMAAASKKGMSLFVEGNAASNDKGNPNKISAARAPTVVTSKTGVEEKSISTYGVPLSFGLGAKFNINDKFGIGTGVNWSLLSRSFSGIYTEVDGSGNVTKSVNSDINNELHYIGIPLNLYYNVMSNRNVKFYVWGGGSAEKGLVNKYRIYSKPESIIYKESVSGLQWSTAAGLGLEFTLTDKLGLYIDPSARYYFDCGQPTSVRTQKPYMLNFEVGMRFNLL